MQRIIRSPDLYSALSANALAAVEQMRSVSPPHLASLFAINRKGSDGQLEWWSPLGGQAIPLAELTQDQQKQLHSLLEQRQAAFASLVEHLDSNGQSDAAESLRKLLSQSDFKQLYSIDNQPVLIDWHNTVTPPEPVILPAAVSTPSAVEDAARVTAASAARVSSTKKRKRWPWLLLLLLLLLLALGLGAWWLWHNQDKTQLSPDNSIEMIAPIDADVSNSSASAPSTIANYACTANSSVPDFVTVFDNSGSMTLHIGASAEDEQWLLESDSLYDHSNRDPKRLNMLKSPTREEVAKHAYINMLDKIHPDINTRLITFKGCEAVVDHGLYSNEQRPKLIQQLLQTPALGGTPLAASLRLAASQVDGVTKDAMIILFIDGEDGCGDNVCTLSAELAQAKPRLQINVMDVSGNGLSSCAAELTGGRLYSSQNISEINTLFTQAAEEFNDHACD